MPADYAMFDCGMGVLANYIAAGIPYGRMDKIFIAHLHADHMSELSAIYCFGESANRKSPLYVWGPSKSGTPDPYLLEQGIYQEYEDGIKAALEHFREVWRWHTESFSFTSNGYEEYTTRILPTLKEDWGLPVDPVPVGKYSQYQDPYNDAYALVPIELDWTNSGKKPGDNIAYWNQKTGLKITHFPVIHCRKGSIGYKLEWNPRDLDGNPIPGAKTLSMIYSSDTKPNWTMVSQAKGIDVLVHEIVMPPDKWTLKFAHTDNTDIIEKKLWRTSKTSKTARTRRKPRLVTSSARSNLAHG
jgi:ribonuclease Z